MSSKNEIPLEGPPAINNPVKRTRKQKLQSKIDNIRANVSKLENTQSSPSESNGGDAGGESPAGKIGFQSLLLYSAIPLITGVGVFFGKPSFMMEVKDPYTPSRKTLNMKKLAILLLAVAISNFLVVNKFILPKI